MRCRGSVMTMKKIRYLLLVIGLVVGLNQRLWAASLVGTMNLENSLYYENTNLVVANGEQFVGFVGFKNGMTLENGAAIWVGVEFPIYGAIALTNGSITIQSCDLVLGSNSWFSSGGTLALNGFDIFFMKQPFDVSISKYLNIQGDGALVFGGQRVFMNASGGANTGTFNVTTGNVVISGADFYDVGSGSFSVDMTHTIVFENCIFNIHSNGWTHTGGSLQFRGTNVFKNGTFTFDSTGLLTIDVGSTLIFDEGTTFSWGGLSPAVGTNSFLTNDGSTLHLRGCSLNISSTGMRFSSVTGATPNNARIIIEDYVTLSAAGTTQSNGLIIGLRSGVSAASGTITTSVMLHGGAYLNVKTGCLDIF